MFSGLRLAFVLRYMRAQAVDSGERLTASFAHIIAEQTERTLQVVDERLRGATADLDRLKAAGRLDRRSASDVLEDASSGLPFLRSLTVTDPDGRAIYSTNSTFIGIDASRHDFFGIHQGEPATGFYVGPPVRGLSTGTWLISASRPVGSSSAALEGLVVAAIEPTYFDKLWETVDPGPGSSVALFRRDGTLMLRSPFDASIMGERFPALAWLERISHSPVGTFQSVSVFDQEQRIFSYRTLPTYPDLVIVVGQSYALVLAPWRHFMVTATSIWGAATLAILLLAGFLGQAARRRLESEARVEELATRLTLATNAAAIAVWDWNLKTDEWTATPTYFTMLGYEPEEGPAHRETWLGRIHPDDRGRVSEAIRATLAGEDPPFDYEVRSQHADGTFRWTRVIGTVLERDADGRARRLLGVKMDTTASRDIEEALRRSLREKESLLKEVHHRVKNNLQVIASLLRLETNRNRESATQIVLKDMQGRIRSMSLLHEALYRTGIFSRVDLAGYLRKLTTELFRAQNTSPGSVRLRLDLKAAEVGIDQAIPCGLIVNELVSNSLKHAFAKGGTGEVSVEVHQDPDRIVYIVVSDSGPGLAPDFEEKRKSSLGLQLVSDLTKQIGGTLEIGSAPSASFTIRFTAAELDDASPAEPEDAAT